MKHSLTIDPNFSALLPQFRMAMIEAKVSNSPLNIPLQRSMQHAEGDIVLKYKLEEIKSIPAVFYTRQAYKTLGKDPNRYRPAAEQLLRRLISGKGLYTISALVDLGNLVSMVTGYSIGVFHAPAVGEKIFLRRGEISDDFEGIGRGQLNIEGLPLYLDEQGPFATPTSDSERTKVRMNTSETLLFVNSYIPKEEKAIEQLQEAVDYTKELLLNFLDASDIEVEYISAT